MSAELEQRCKQIDELLNLPRQIWFLGAGISKDAGIPLMFPLTDRVENILEGKNNTDFKAIRKLLPNDSHVEHVLSHIGDLIALASRKSDKRFTDGGVIGTVDDFLDLYKKIQNAIRDIIRWGYSPKDENKPELIGTSEKPIVSIDPHLDFIRALYQHRRSGLENRPPVAFFTINYDTLLEDALALCRIPTADGFSGGAMAFWQPNRSDYSIKNPLRTYEDIQARIYKLHGSIDWFISEEDIVVRRRERAGYPPEESGNLLIYPQANKYKVIQKDPFASLFSAFRDALTNASPDLLVICGYSFGDDHINEEIERSLKQRDNSITILAFVNQDQTRISESDEGLPSPIAEWLGDSKNSWKERIVIAGSHGVYHGSLNNQALLKKSNGDTPYSWWTFKGLTKFLIHGPEGLK